MPFSEGMIVHIEIGEQMTEIFDDILDLPCEYKEVDTDEDGSFEGYASVFGNKDLGNDVVEKGAFMRSLKYKKPKHQA